MERGWDGWCSRSYPGSWGNSEDRGTWFLEDFMALSSQPWTTHSRSLLQEGIHTSGFETLWLDLFNNWLQRVSSQPTFFLLQPICWSRFWWIWDVCEVVSGSLLMGNPQLWCPDVADDILSWLEEFGTDCNLTPWVSWMSMSYSGDCSHEIKRHLLLGRKAMTNLDGILKSRDITLPTKVHLIKAMVFPVVMCGCENWTIKKTERQRIDAFELWCWRRLLRVPWTTRRSNQSILKETSPEYSLEGLMLAETPILWPPDVKNWLFGKDTDAGKDWRREVGIEGDDRGWNGWMASLTG